ncbi:MAG: MG2 domain-containing protein, partial [Terracidiphilus sp.]
AQSGALRIELLVPGEDPRALFSGHLNHRGTVEADFQFPLGLTGNYQMRYTVDTPIGSAEDTQAVDLKNEASILLTTEKPIYQPGQTMHARALVLDRASHRAAGGQKLTFEIEDSRGNRVFRKATETDKFGIASAEFTLADEVNLGAYHLRALMGNPQTPASSAELTLDVERYVLPKFKVEIDFDKQDNKPRRDYRPDDDVAGTVRANYFFGKPVDHADVTVKISSMDVAIFEAASAAGKTDADGNYHFELKLPSYFAGRPLSQGAARALVEATVTDSAAHAETRGEPITISASPLSILAIPEGGALVPDVENEVYILTSYPDGSPARTTLRVHVPSSHGDGNRTEDRQISTDESGVAVLRIDPSPGVDSLRIDADDGHGSHVTSDVPLETRAGTDQILLHADRAVVKAGDPIALKVLSTRTRGTVYIDIVKDGQTILTRDVDLANGEADLAIESTPAMAGTLDIDAYLFGHDAEPVADHRLVFVQPAEELKIAATADSPVYLPGSEARIQFHVTNARGQGVEAALGLQVVDEAVFALAEKQPGFAKVFFYLEQELMKPRYEIHSLSMNSVAEAGGDAKDLDAQALFSATQMASPAKLDVQFGRGLSDEKFDEYQQQYREALVKQVRQLAAELSARIERRSGENRIVKEFATLENGARPRDAWNTPLRIEPTGWNWGGTRYFRVVSAGTDRRFNTGDDLTVFIQERSGAVVSQPGPSGTFDLRMEHDRGPFNGRAETTGTISDATGAVVPDAAVTLRSLSGAGTRVARSDAEGWFDFSALPPGRYRIEVSSPGFVAQSRDFSLTPRDRAVFSITLAVGEAAETVEVEAAPMPMGGPLIATGLMGGNFRAGMGTGMGAGMHEDAIAEGEMGAPTAAMANRPLEGRSFMVLTEKTVAAPASAASPAAAPHIRSYFPEALYINPEIITDANGDASVSIPVADSITTWRMAMLASTVSGA